MIITNQWRLIDMNATPCAQRRQFKRKHDNGEKRAAYAQFVPAFAQVVE